jgi:hypothetical protein
MGMRRAEGVGCSYEYLQMKRARFVAGVKNPAPQYSAKKALALPSSFKGPTVEKKGARKRRREAPVPTYGSAKRHERERADGS